MASLALRWLSRRSLRLLHALGGALGWTAYALSPPYRRLVRGNAALAGVGSAKRRASVAEAGRMLAELPRLWLRPGAQPFGDPLRWQGAELIDAALVRGRGLILLTPHMGSFEVAAQAYAQRYGQRQPITVLYRPARQAWLRELEETARARPGLHTAPASLAGVRQMMRALRQGQTLGMLPDQVPPEGLGTWAPFFGQPAYTMTLAARLAQQSGAEVLLVWCERLPRGAGFVVHVQALGQALPSRDGLNEAAWTRAAATCINRAMETLILHKPEQYLWGYHRYKRPRTVEPE